MHLKTLFTILLISVPAFAQVPDAPKPQPYFHNTLNRSLAASEMSARFMDAVSTHAFEVDPCKCIHEVGKFYGTFSLAPISANTPALFAWSMGMAALHIEASKKLWDVGQRARPKTFKRRAFTLASRGVLIYDLRYEVEAPINNYRLIATNGKKGF